MAAVVSELIPRETRPIQTRWRRIVTPLPAPASIPTLERLRSIEPLSMAGMPPVLWEEAEGFLVRDAFGNQWIDLTSGIVVANAGHAHPRIVAALREQLERNLLHTYAFPSTQRMELLSQLVALSPIPDSKAIVFSSGTEATECAMMLMRRHGRKISASKVGILSFASSYHGRTLAAALASGAPGPSDWIARDEVKHYQIPFPFCPRCPWGKSGYDQCGETCFAACLDSLDQRGISPDQIAGMILEPLPGWATWPVPRDFAAAMFKWARQHEILITFDEIQCGSARTGTFMGGEHLGVVPDLITLGKGLTSSLPVSAVIGSRELMDVPGPGEMSSTHGGNPLCVTAARANLAVIEDEKLAARSAETGQRVLAELSTLQDEFPVYVKSIHGRGLFISVHLTTPETDEPHIALADATVMEAVRRGVLMFLTGRGFFKVVPPLCIDPEAAMEAAGVIKECLSDCIAQLRNRRGSVFEPCMRPKDQETKSGPSCG